MSNTQTEPRTYRLEDHQSWGDKLDMRTQTSLTGCMDPMPTPGDFLTTEQDGHFFKWEFIKITKMPTVRDGFFADLKRIQ